jgi:hypothetical protein
MEDYTELIKTVEAYDWGRSGAPLLLIDAEVRKLLGHPDRLAALEDALIRVLASPNASIAAKQGVCKRLGLIATRRSLGLLTAMLIAPETSDMARYALESIPLDAVDSSLRSALLRTEGRTRVGIIHSVGNRRDARAVPLVGKLSFDPDDTTAQAAAWALGRIGGHDAIRVLSARKDTARGRVRLEVLDAYLVCARRLASQGDKKQAMAMYKELSAEAMPAPIRRAASLGVKAVAG